MTKDLPQGWPAIRQTIDRDGYAILRRLWTPEQCCKISALYDQPARFRSRIVMRRYGFGEGEYQYFQYPLPDSIRTLRGQIYPQLVPLANLWMERLGLEQRFPPQHAEFIRVCHDRGQRRPTPLLLRYGAGDYNRLHQDLYGDIWFPLQLAILLNAPGKDFTGGEFVLTEQKPRFQSKAIVVPLQQGDAVIFAVNDRPAPGSRGYFRLKMRHGVSEVRSGSRHTLGIIFHDAQ
jgi:hypothetical protein